MFFRRILVLSIILPQLALGQVVVKPSASNTAAEAQLLNRAARAELRGYAIQQEMQTLGEEFAKDPGYQWDARSLAFSRLSSGQKVKAQASNIVPVVSGIAFVVGVFGYLALGDVKALVAYSHYKWWVLGFAGVGLVAAIVTHSLGSPLVVRSADEEREKALNSFKDFVLGNALQNDLADCRVSFIHSLFPLSSPQKRNLRDSLVLRHYHGNYTIDGALLKNSGLTPSQVSIFEKFQKDTTASVGSISQGVELQPLDVASNAILHLEALKEQLDKRIEMLQDVRILPPKEESGSILAAEVYQRHLGWSQEIGVSIAKLNAALAAVAAEK